ncbi:MAG: 50S ribosomal protein L13 [Deltaproteobacteria bacterium]
MKTYMPDKDSVPRKWYLVDIKGKTLGRVATAIAAVLRGKHKPTYTPSIDTGDFVVVINSGKVSVTGKKLTDKMYHHHTGYPGGLRSVALGKLLQTKPEAAIEKAVQGMLPSGPLGRDMFKKLKVYAGDKHPHAAQNPEPLNLG